jgi:hypothetical protein
LLVTTLDDDAQLERCLMLWARILHQSFADLIALTNGDSLLTDDGRRMWAAERAETLAEVLDWFFGDSASPVSLEAVCDILSINPGWMRGRARSILAGAQAIKLRRHKLTRQERAQCCEMLQGGVTTSICAKKLSVEHFHNQKIEVT